MRKCGPVLSQTDRLPDKVVMPPRGSPSLLRPVHGRDLTESLTGSAASLAVAYSALGSLGRAPLPQNNLNFEEQMTCLQYYERYP